MAGFSRIIAEALEGWSERQLDEIRAERAAQLAVVKSFVEQRLRDAQAKRTDRKPKRRTT